MKEIIGGVCAAQGFRAAGIHCGIRKNREKADLALIVSDRDCAAAACYTRNRVKAAPVYVSMEHLKDGRARAVICNSGNANACAPNGKENAIRMCKATAQSLGIDPMDVVCTSTGVIGEELPVHVIENAMGSLVSDLSYDGGDRAANAILTTDTVKKECSFTATIGGNVCNGAVDVVVRMVFFCKCAVSRADLVVRCVWGYPKHLIRVHGYAFSFSVLFKTRSILSGRPR